MTKDELRTAYEFGKEIIRECKANGEVVSKAVYERMLELADKIFELMEEEA